VLRAADLRMAELVDADPGHLRIELQHFRTTIGSAIRVELGSW
jgi:hypothetical protein